jgi:hypothetical protein
MDLRSGGAMARGSRLKPGGSGRAVEIDRQTLGTPKRIEKGLLSPAPAASIQGFCPLNASQDTFECQLTNVPLGLSFHAQTCSV